MDECINWLKFRAEVAKTMLPIVYREISADSRSFTSRDKNAAARAAEIAEMLEQELKRGYNIAKR